MTSLSDRILQLFINWAVLILSPVWVLFFIIFAILNEGIFKDVFITGKKSIAKGD